MKELVRVGRVVLVLGWLAAGGGCSSPTEDDCTAGTCSPTAGAGVTAGSGGSGAGSVGTAGQGGNTSSAGGGQGPGTSGSTSGGGGGMSFGGASVAGQGGSDNGQAGNPPQAGQGGQGGSGGGAAGAGGTPDSSTPGQCKDDYWPATNNGAVTRYDFRQGTSLPACAYVITHTGNGQDGDWDTVEGISTGDGGYFGAMNTTDYQQGAACGACVEASYNGRKVVLTIVDECPITTNPLCVKGHIDLSRKAIRQLEPNGSLEHLKGVSWKYVKCPAAGNAKVRLHPNQNPNWQPVVIENGLYPLKSVTLNGANATRTGNNSGGNAWIANGQKAPYLVRATDVNGGVLTFNYSGGSGLKDVGLQFTCQ